MLILTGLVFMDSVEDTVLLLFSLIFDFAKLLIIVHLFLRILILSPPL